MSLDLSRIGESVGDPHLDPLLMHFARLFGDPAVTSAVADLQRKIVDRLRASNEELNGIDRRSERGTFVLSGIKELLEQTRADVSAISIEMIMGSVDVINDDVHIAVGNLTIPYDSRWARQHFVNTNPLGNVERYAFTPYRAFEHWIDPKDVTRDGPGAAFLLSEREAIAAQILMVINAAVGYRNLTISALEERETVGREYGTVKAHANLHDLHDTLAYAEELREELRNVRVEEDPNERLIRGMSKAARALQPPLLE